MWQIRAVANIAVRDRNRIEFIGNCATIASTSVTVIDWIIDVMCVLVWCTQQRKRNESGMKFSIFVFVMCCRFAVSVVFFGFWMFDVFFGRKQELADENYDIFI